MWWNNKVNDIDVKCFEGDFYVRLQDYEKLLEELNKLKEKNKNI